MCFAARTVSTKIVSEMDGVVSVGRLARQSLVEMLGWLGEGLAFPYRIEASRQD